MTRTALVPQAKNTAAAPPPTKHTRIPALLNSVNAVQPTTISLRDGELVVYRRSRSHRYQCRYRLPDGTWHRTSTHKASLEQAIAAACDIYDEARYRQRLGLAHRAHCFAHTAHLVLAELRQQIEAAAGTFSPLQLCQLCRTLFLTLLWWTATGRVDPRRHWLLPLK